MDFFKFVPLVMVKIPVSIQIDRLEYIRHGLREVVLKFLPTDQLISVGIHVGKMGVEALWVRQFILMMLGLRSTT